MSVYQKLEAVEALLNDLLAEQDSELLRAQLREGPFPDRSDGKPFAPEFPFEELTIGVALNVATLADQFYHHIREQFPRPPGSRAVVGTNIISTWKGPAEPKNGPHET